MTADMREYIIPVLKRAVADPETVSTRLLERFGTVSKLAFADYDELLAVEGMNEAAALILRLSFSLAARCETDKFKLNVKHTEEEIVGYLKALFFSLSNETVYLLTLDSEGRVTSSEYMGEGTVNSSSVLPRKLLEVAIKKRASSVILAHNHPMGVATPSVDDIEVTSTIASLFRASERELLCHYVIAGDKHYKIEI